MRRAEILQVKGSLTIRSYDVIPKPPKGGVVLKTSFAGVCHSDLHALDDEIDINETKKFRFSANPTYKFPIVLGHEISGIVHSLGEDDGEHIELKVGDKAVIYPWTGCMECEFCKHGETNLCQNPLDSIGFGNQGGFSEYVVVNKKRYVVRIPDSIPLDVASMLPCSGITAYNGVTKVKSTIELFVNREGQAALMVVGAGGLGLWCLQTAKTSLPKGTKIICADISAEKLQNALDHGADDIVLWDPNSSIDENITIAKEKGINNKIHAVIDFVNNSTTSTQGFGCLTNGGAMALVGLFGGTMNISLPLYAWGMYQMSGVYVGTLRQLHELVNLVAENKDEYDATLATHIPYHQTHLNMHIQSILLIPPNISYIGLEDIERTIEKMRKGQLTGRALVKF